MVGKGQRSIGTEVECWCIENLGRSSNRESSSGRDLRESSQREFTWSVVDIRVIGENIDDQECIFSSSGSLEIIVGYWSIIDTRNENSSSGSVGRKRSEGIYCLVGEGVCSTEVRVWGIADFCGTRNGESSIRCRGDNTTE